MTILVTMENPERTGAPRMVLEYTRALVSAGHRVLIAAGPPSEEATSIVPELEAAGAEVHRVPPLAPRNVAAVLARLRDTIRDEGVDCVVGSQQRDRVLACLAAWLTATRCVVFAQSQHVFRGGAVQRRLKEGIYRWALRRRADRVICVSEAVEEEVRRRFGVDDSQTRVVVNGIDIGAFPMLGDEEARTVRRELAVADDERLVLNVGRIDRQKGQDLLVRAFRGVARRHPRARLAVVGAVGRSSASAEARRYHLRLRSMVEADGLEDRVHLLGWRDDVPRLLAAADVYVQPSRWEGWPLALVEAMAAGLPVVASDCSGRPTGFVDGEHGWIVPTEDVGALGEALDRALSMTESELRTAGARSRRLAERNYDIHRLGERFVEHVEEVLAS